MLSISSGLMSPSGLLAAEFAEELDVEIGIPSTTTKGKEESDNELSP